MLANAPIIAFAATADPSAALAFYRDLLGLRLVEDSPFALVFDAAGCELRIQKVAEVAAPPYTALGWAVADIEATVDRLSARGLRFARFDGLDQDARAIWHSPSGARVAWFRDPGGHLLSLTARA